MELSLSEALLSNVHLNQTKPIATILYLQMSAITVSVLH
ncbi:hypothetical protein Anas_13368 [Armadillidium nasatum]|uniref:Uncharacterized protein n=1 Tax=Armadillidium nasatum TaxID=96803 RepID=A0A5N5TE94_9CRUS|nr:hypothetical protein Anas_13368 [Armadillidium nasatum]